jgi:hypothetical protein
MITHQMEADLRELGFSQERINTMTPGEAWEILQAEAGRIAGELAKLHRAGAIKNDQDASFYASLVRIFGATVSPAQEPAPPPITSEQLVPGPPRWLSREERAACYAADLEGAIGEEFIDHDPQPPARPARSSTRKKKRSPRKTAQ